MGRRVSRPPIPRGLFARRGWLPVLCSAGCAALTLLGACASGDDAAESTAASRDVGSARDGGGEGNSDTLQPADVPATTDANSDTAAADDPDANDVADADADATADAPDAGDLDSAVDDAVDSSVDGAVDAADEPEICATETIAATLASAPADILWVVDNSMSMQEEVAAVSRGINAFSSFIEASGADAHVVMISWDDPVVGDGWYHVCVPPPLSDTAPGVCPDGRDVDSDRYLHVRVTVDSEQPLQRIIDQFAVYRSFLRPGAATHIVVVSDDDSALSAPDFQAQLAGLSPPITGPVRVHSIVTRDSSEIVDNFDGCVTPGCPCGYHVGDEYLALSAATGGLVSSICAPDWTPVFDAIAASVVETTSVPCSYEIPELADHASIDPHLVNVFSTEGDSRAAVPNVEGAGACGTEAGWYYDNPVAPSRVQLCPASCVGVSGGVQLEYGCETIKR